MDRHHVTAKQKGQARRKMCDGNGDPFIATLRNVLLEPDLCDRFFSIITLMKLGRTCLFHKGFCTVNFIAEEKIQLYCDIVHKGKINFGGNQGNVKNKENYLLGRNFAL